MFQIMQTFTRKDIKKGHEAKVLFVFTFSGMSQMYWTWNFPLTTALSSFSPRNIFVPMAGTWRTLSNQRNLKRLCAQLKKATAFSISASGLKRSTWEPQMQWGAQILPQCRCIARKVLHISDRSHRIHGETMMFVDFFSCFRAELRV